MQGWITFFQLLEEISIYVVFNDLKLRGFLFDFSGRKEVQDVKSDFDLLIHYMDHEYKFNVHKVITEGHNKQLEVKR